MKRAIILALVAGIAAVLAATAVARPTDTTGTAAPQAVNCNSPLKIAIVTPLTGGAGFLGNAQLSWAKYAVKRLAPGLGLKIQLVTGDTPVEQGPAPAQALAQKYVADQKVVAVIGPATSGAVAATSQTYFAAGVAHISTRRDSRLLPGRPGRFHPGPERRSLHGRQAEGQEGRADRLPGAVLGRPGRRGGGSTEVEQRCDRAAVDVGADDGLLVPRDTDSE
jgi:hypothetical protein